MIKDHLARIDDAVAELETCNAKKVEEILWVVLQETQSLLNQRLHNEDDNLQVSVRLAVALSDIANNLRIRALESETEERVTLIFESIDRVSIQIGKLTYSVPLPSIQLQ